MSKIEFDPQQFANAYLSAQELDVKHYESEQEMIDEAFSIYIQAYERAMEYVENYQIDE